MAVSYKELGLVNTKEMFAKAVKGGYAIPAFNFNTMEQMQAIVQAAVKQKSPVIMQVSKGPRNSAAPIRRSCSTSTTVTLSNSARTASTTVSLP